MNDELRLRKRLKDDLAFYCLSNIIIRVKRPIDGKKLLPFRFNKAQKYIHEKLEEQLYRTGRIRALILKGRQQGCSTYVAARFYHKTTFNEGIKTYILSHLDDATSNLFNMVKRFHKKSKPTLQPSTQYSSKKELDFDELDSSYALGTSGSGDGGRSDTIDFFHGSEVAFWKNTDKITTGVMQAAEQAKEIILESTANGFDPMFHAMWSNAEANMSDYEAIFVPWFWQDEYYIKPPKDFEIADDEQKLLTLYGDEGLELGNIVWRRNKLRSDFRNDEALFKQEYPCTSAEAFQNTGIDSFIKPDRVIEARKRKGGRQTGAHIVGIDPARGGDRTYFMHRQGKVAWEGYNTKTPDTKVIIGKIRELFDGAKPVDWVVIDIGGLGGPIYDQVRDLEFGEYVIPINFGSKEDVNNKERYTDKSSEMWGETRDWFYDDIDPASITDSDDIQSALCTRSYTYDHLQRYVMEPKKKMKLRNLPSPDPADALALTFAKPFAPRSANDNSLFEDNDSLLL